MFLSLSPSPFLSEINKDIFFKKSTSCGIELTTMTSTHLALAVDLDWAPLLCSVHCSFSTCQPRPGHMVTGNIASKILKKFKIPTSGIYPKKPKTLTSKNTCSPMFLATLFTTAKIWKQPTYPSVDEWIKKLWYIYTMEYNAAVKKKDLLPFEATWRGVESIMLS
uniref:Uncharacterized protein n=1 Tax=Myotis myotis TaxID=51298 RepID=A0A7J7Y0B4_MYOMY|nr:hypothetical protein mMyoMyo1_011538 [Myotis myotis]